MKTYTPYTYLIVFPVLGLCYYGVRYGKGCHPDDFLTEYFSHSNPVKKLIRLGHEVDGEIRRTFETAKEAIDWEAEVLRKMCHLRPEGWSKMINNHTAKAISPDAASKGARLQWLCMSKEEQDKKIKAFGNNGGIQFRKLHKHPDAKLWCSKGGKKGQETLKSRGYDMSAVASLSSIGTTWCTDGKKNRRIKNPTLGEFLKSNPSFKKGSTKRVVMPDCTGCVYLHAPDLSVRKRVHPSSQKYRDLISMGYFNKNKPKKEMT